MTQKRPNSVLLPLMILLASTGMAVEGLASPAAHPLSIENVVARIEISPAQKDQIGVTITPGSAAIATPKAFTRNGATWVEASDTYRKLRNISCQSSNGETRIRINNGAWVAVKDLPLIRITAPENTDLSVTDSMVILKAGNLGSAKLELQGCTDTLIGNVANALNVELSGSGNVMTGNAGSLNAALSGSGNGTFGSIASDARFEISGSGDLTAASVNGQLSAEISGSGNILVKAGDVSALSAEIAGSGDITFNGKANSPRAEIAGSGTVRIKEVTGTPEWEVAGSGEIYANGSRVPGLRH